jgi:hypothetical protein
VAAGAVLYANYSVAAGADTHVKGFVDTCHKDKEGVTKGITSEDITCYKDKEGVQRRKKIITSLIRVKLRRL